MIIVERIDIMSAVYIISYIITPVRAGNPGTRLTHYRHYASDRMFAVVAAPKQL